MSPSARQTAALHYYTCTGEPQSLDGDPLPRPIPHMQDALQQKGSSERKQPPQMTHPLKQPVQPCLGLLLGLKPRQQAVATAPSQSLPDHRHKVRSCPPLCCKFRMSASHAAKVRHTQTQHACLSQQFSPVMYCVVSPLSPLPTILMHESVWPHQCEKRRSERSTSVLGILKEMTS